MVLLQERVAAATQIGAMRIMDEIELRAKRANLPAAGAAYKWVWIVLIGILIVAAAVAFIYCRNRGYDGFTGNIEAVRGPFGIKIGIKIGCY
jgi:hypothetical protein